MKFLQDFARKVRTRIVHPLNDCISLRRKHKQCSAGLRKEECSFPRTSAASGSRSEPYLASAQQAISYNNCQNKSSITTANPLSPPPLLHLSPRANASPTPSSQTRLIGTSIILNQSRTMTSTPVGNDEALLASARAFIPNLTNAMHKGQAGRIGVIGGSEEYTGAPYFSAISSLKVGADLAHVFCVKSASPVIKSYSPELIVHPLLDSDNAVEQILDWAPRMHCFVVGPGLGRDPKILNVVEKIIEKLKEMEKPMIIDADGLFLVTNKIELIRNYPKVILTPNSVEFSRLSSAVFGEEVKPAPSASAEKVKELAMTLGYVTILHKGATDVASNGRLVVCCAGGGSNRRCGGQGDLLAGALAVVRSTWLTICSDSHGFAPFKMPYLLIPFHFPHYSYSTGL